MHDREADQAVFTVRLTDRRGNPIPDAKVAVIPLYGSGEGSGIPLTSPSTDVTGAAIGSVFYCKESGFGEMPDDVVREVNNALERFRSAD